MSLDGIYDVKVLLDEERDISPTLAFFFRGCDLWCRFCMDHHYAWTHAEHWPVAGERFRRLLSLSLKHSAEAEMESVGRLKTISLIGGEPSLRWRNIGEAFLSLGFRWEGGCQGRLRNDSFLESYRGDFPGLVLNTNMLFPHGEGPETWKGIVTYFLADFKFGNDRCAEELTLPGAPARYGKRLDYLGRIEENILRASKIGKVVIRHLALPGHLRCCTEPILKWIKDNAPDLPVHLLLDYYPNGCSGLRGLTVSEKHEALKMAQDYGVSLYTAPSFPDLFENASHATGEKALVDTELSCLAALESRVRRVFQNAGCALRSEAIQINSDGSLVAPDLSAGIGKMLSVLRKN